MDGLMSGQNVTVTPEEFAEKWHFCYEWDGLLIGPGMPEMECCTCFKAEASQSSSPLPSGTGSP